MGSTARLIVLGSGTAVPRAGRATSCYLVDDGAGRVLLVDCGPGALHRAAQAGYPLDSLDGALLTHTHPDHCADLIAVQFALRNPQLGRRPRPFVVAGDASVARLVARLDDAWAGKLAPEAGQFVVQSIGPGAFTLPDLAPGATGLQAFPVAHIAGSLGFRLTLADGFTLAFSGDATEGAELEALGRDADLFVLEAAAPDRHPMDGHLSPTRAARVAQQCGARHLLLTHFYPAVLDEPIALQARTVFEGRLTLAEDGLILPLVR